MKVKIFAICDNAFFDEKKKLNMIGVFDLLNGKKEPLSMVKVAVAGALFDIENNEKKTLQVSLKDSKGEEVLPATSIKINPKNNAASFVINIGTIVFKEFGQYTFELIDEDEVIADFPLKVEQESSE